MLRVQLYVVADGEIPSAVKGVGRVGMKNKNNIGYKVILFK